MTEKRFTCHQMIADYSTGEDLDFDFLQELIDKQEQPKDLRMHISDGNKIITYRECVDLLNDLHEERNYFERKKDEYWNKFNLTHLDNINLRKENEQLKKRNDNQYNQLDQLWQLIQAKDWETLIEMDNKMKEDEERLKKEWACYE